MARKKKGIKPHHITIGSIIFVFLLIILVVGLIRLGPFAAEPEGSSIYQFDSENQVVLYPSFALYSPTVTMGEIVLAKQWTENSLIANKTFDKDTKIYFILANATGFQVQPDGYSWYDVDVEIAREDGTVVYSQMNTLGEKGKLYLKSDVVTPYGLIDVPQEAQNGDYSLTVRLYDQNTLESVSRTTKFTIFEKESILDPVFAA